MPPQAHAKLILLFVVLVLQSPVSQVCSIREVRFHLADIREVFVNGITCRILSCGTMPGVRFPTTERDPLLCIMRGLWRLGDIVN